MLKKWQKQIIKWISNTILNKKNLPSLSRCEVRASRVSCKNKKKKRKSIMLWCRIGFSILNLNIIPLLVSPLGFMSEQMLIRFSGDEIYEDKNTLKSHQHHHKHSPGLYHSPLKIWAAKNDFIPPVKSKLCFKVMSSCCFLRRD